MSIKWEVVSKQLKDLKPYAKNPRIIGGKKLEDLKKSIKKFGMADVITLNLDNTIIGGHARYYTMTDEGTETALCLVPNRMLTEKEVEELNIRLNKNTAGEWDHDILANQFDMEELKEWGFEEFEFGGFDAGSEDEQGRLDKAGAKDEKDITCPECGHIWKPSDLKNQKSE